MAKKKYPKPSEYPLLVPVRNAIYHVVFASKMKGDLKGCLGYCNDDSKIIALSLEQDPKEMLATFYHELLHAFESEYGVDLGHPSIRKLEWLIVDTMALFPEAR